MTEIATIDWFGRLGDISFLLKTLLYFLLFLLLNASLSIAVLYNPLFSDQFYCRLSAVANI